MKPRRLAPLFAALAFTSGAALADVTKVADCSTPAGCFLISGEITDADATALAQISQFLDGRKLSRPAITLNSHGGSVDAAIAAGRTIRQMRAWVSVPSKGHCLSACVFLLAGGATRLVSGEVGIHRPYTPQIGQLDIQQIQENYRATQDKAKEFLRDMNLSDRLYDAMVQVPSEQMRILDFNELEYFGLNRGDPVEDEYVDSASAAKYGINKAEYLKRKAVADKCPNVVETFDACVEHVFSTGYLPSQKPQQDSTMEAVLAQAYRDFPFLDHTRPYAYRPAIDEVVKVRDALIAKGYSGADAIREAVRQVGPKYAGKAATANGDGAALAAVLREAYARYPFLDYERPDANQAAIDEVLQVRNALMAQGYGAAEAIRAAVNQVGPKYTNASRNN
ncbi:MULTISPECIES: COG3904 family protein [Pseudomonadaceae]|uniref:ATP-dependent Clp protease proteolytic subunit n=1 Tax=Pseudomonadaceae TaxID=135621 RepID=UPI00084BA656|nr:MULTISPECIES: ATP-dependent Clp protease proteolytic subunit [Pseudomonas]OEC59413.1 hypothetical protein A9G05_11945 [Pseudomonas sp. ENNP23]